MHSNTYQTSLAIYIYAQWPCVIASVRCNVVGMNVEFGSATLCSGLLQPNVPAVAGRILPRLGPDEA